MGLKAHGKCGVCFCRWWLWWLFTHVLLEKLSPAASMSKGVWDQTVESSFLWIVGPRRGDFYFFILCKPTMKLRGNKAVVGLGLCKRGRWVGQKKSDIHPSPLYLLDIADGWPPQAKHQPYPQLAQKEDRGGGCGRSGQQCLWQLPS